MVRARLMTMSGAERFRSADLLPVGLPETEGKRHLFERLYGTLMPVPE